MLIKQCCDVLERVGLKAAFIESASSGYLATQFSVYKNSGAEILLGGLVSYDPEIKIQLLGVSRQLIEQHTAESQQVTDEMARLGKGMFINADIIVACTGLLKHGGSECAEKPVGTFFISINYHNQIHAYRYLIEGDEWTKLNTLSQYTAQELLKLLNPSSIETIQARNKNDNLSS